MGKCPATAGIILLLRRKIEKYEIRNESHSRGRTPR